MALTGTSWEVEPSRILVREGGGCMALFGLPFLAAGIFLLLISLGVLRLENPEEVPGWGWPVMGLMGLVFTGVGGTLALGRRWTTLDAGRGVLLKQWGPLVPLHREEHRLEGFEAVVLRVLPGDSDSSDHYEVLLRGRGEGRLLPLSSSHLYGESRERAAAVAKLLGFPLVDAATSRESLLPPDRVDATFQDRVREGEEEVGAASRPLRMRCQVRESVRGVEIFLPEPPFRLRKLLGLALPLGVGAFGIPHLLRFFRETDTPEVVQVVFLAFAGFLFVLLPVMGVLGALLLSMRGGTTLAVSREEVALEERGAWRRRLTRIPAAGILGVEAGTSDAQVASALREGGRQLHRAGGLPPQGRPPFQGRLPPPHRGSASGPRWLSAVRRLVSSKGIILKTRADLVTFGAGLPDDELRYLHALLVRALGGRR